MPIPLLEGIKGFETGKFVNDPSVAFPRKVARRLRRFLFSEIIFENMSWLLDRAGVVG